MGCVASLLAGIVVLRTTVTVPSSVLQYLRQQLVPAPSQYDPEFSLQRQDAATGYAAR